MGEKPGRYPARKNQLDSNLSTAIVSASGSLVVAIVAILTNNKRIDDLAKRMDQRFESMERRMDQRFDAMEKLFTEKLLRVEQVMDARIRHLEDNH
jgi:hypothetical protein